MNTVASYGQLLSAPAYEDATLFDAVEIQPGNAPADSKPAAPATAVTVDDPVKKVENTIIPGMSGGYVTYRVSTKTSLEFASKEVSVRRRFRDFVVSSGVAALHSHSQCAPCWPDNRMSWLYRRCTTF